MCSPLVRPLAKQRHFDPATESHKAGQGWMAHLHSYCATPFNTAQCKMDGPPAMDVRPSTHPTPPAVANTLKSDHTSTSPPSSTCLLNVASLPAPQPSPSCLCLPRPGNASPSVILSGSATTHRDPSMSTTNPFPTRPLPPPPPPIPQPTSPSEGPSTKPIEAYFKLAFDDFSYYLQTLSVTIGRRVQVCTSDISDSSFHHAFLLSQTCFPLLSTNTRRQRRATSPSFFPPLPATAGPRLPGAPLFPSFPIPEPKQT